MRLGEGQAGEEFGFVEKRRELRLGTGADPHGVLLGAGRARFGLGQNPHGRRVRADAPGLRPHPGLQRAVLVGHLGAATGRVEHQPAPQAAPTVAKNSFSLQPLDEK